MEGAGRWEGMLGDIDVAGDVVLHLDAQDAVHGGGCAVAPLDIQLRAVGGAGSVGIGEDGKTVGKAADVLVGDLPRALVRGEQSETAEQKQEENQKSAHNHPKLRAAKVRVFWELWGARFIASHFMKRPCHYGKQTIKKSRDCSRDFCGMEVKDYFLTNFFVTVFSPFRRRK